MDIKKRFSLHYPSVLFSLYRVSPDKLNLTTQWQNFDSSVSESKDGQVIGPGSFQSNRPTASPTDPTTQVLHPSYMCEPDIPGVTVYATQSVS